MRHRVNEEVPECEWCSNRNGRRRSQTVRSVTVLARRENSVDGALHIRLKASALRTGLRPTLGCRNNARDQGVCLRASSYRLSPMTLSESR